MRMPTPQEQAANVDKDDEYEADKGSSSMKSLMLSWNTQYVGCKTYRINTG